jgi:hypothetical protein
MAKFAACPSCESRLSLAEEMNGRRIKCPRCKQVLQVGDGQLWLAASPAAAPTAPPPPQYASEEYMTGEPVVEEEAREPRRRRRRRRWAGPTDYGLSGGEFALYGLLFFVVPVLNFVVGLAMYFTWRESYPRKARQINGLSWGVFGTQAVIGLIVGGIIWGVSSFGFKQFTSEERDFTILFPGTPERREADERVSYGLKKDDVGFAVASEAPPFEAANSSETEMILSLYRVARLRSVVVLSEKKISLDSRYSGREYVVAFAADQRIRRRVYVINNRIYTVDVYGSSETVDSRQATKFLESFKYIGKE